MFYEGFYMVYVLVFQESYLGVTGVPDLDIQECTQESPGIWTGFWRILKTAASAKTEISHSKPCDTHTNKSKSTHRVVRKHHYLIIV